VLNIENNWQLFWGKYLKNTSKKGDKDAIKIKAA